MISVDENYLNNLKHDKPAVILRLGAAHLIERLLNVKANYDEYQDIDYKEIINALLSFINSTKYKEINAKIEPFNFKTIPTNHLKKYGSYTKNKIFATKKNIFIQYSQNFYLQFDLIY